MIVLGIETSCDETAAAVVDGGRKILGSVVASQDDGPRAPTAAWSRSWPRAGISRCILPVVRGALEQAGASGSTTSTASR